MGKAVHEVRGTVQRIDDPLEIAAALCPALLGEKCMVGMASANGVDDPPLRDPIDLGDEVVRRLLRNGECVEAVDIVRDDVAGLPGRADRDVQ